MNCVTYDARFLVSAFSALFTLCAVLVALFGKEIRSKIRAPQLCLSLARDGGLSVTVVLSSAPNLAIGMEQRRERSRWYHLRVSNPRRKADAVHGVSVSLLSVARKGPDGHYHETWSGDVPITWRNEPDGPPERRVVGTWADVDLCSVIKDKWLMLHVKIQPNDLQTQYRVSEMPVDLAVTVQARGNEVDSSEQVWRIVWDGKWEDGEKEMQSHLRVERLET